MFLYKEGRAVNLTVAEQGEKSAGGSDDARLPGIPQGDGRSRSQGCRWSAIMPVCTWESGDEVVTALRENVVNNNRFTLESYRVS